MCIRDRHDRGAVFVDGQRVAVVKRMHPHRETVHRKLELHTAVRGADGFTLSQGNGAWVPANDGAVELTAAGAAQVFVATA